MPPELDTARFYENHIRRYGYDYRALGFGRRSSQEKRFQKALSLGDFHGKRVQPTLERLFDLARIGMAVNFLSRCAVTRSPGRLYLHPADVLQFALKLTPAVRLDHTYMPNDFTLCLYRQPPWEID